MGSRQDPAALYGRRLRSGGSSIKAGQAPQAHKHLDRTVACCQRRQRARVRSASLESQPNCATPGFTPMTSSRSPASSSRFSNNWRARASTTSGASRLSSGLQAATSSLSRWPGKDWRRRRAPGGTRRACFMTRRPSCAKSSTRCG